MKDKIDTNVLVTSMGVFVTAATAITAIGTITGIADDLVVTEYELDKRLTQHEERPHDVARIEMDDIRRESKCLNIDLQILVIEDQIYRLEHEDPTAQRLVDLRRTLRNLEQSRITLNCSEFD